MRSSKHYLIRNIPSSYPLDEWINVGIAELARIELYFLLSHDSGKVASNKEIPYSVCLESQDMIQFDM